MKIHHPPHQGEVLKTMCLEPLNLTVTDAARSLGVSRKTLSGILNGRAGISPEMAVRSRSPLALRLRAGSTNSFSTICGMRNGTGSGSAWRN
jgi:addiction module HigA family antidote